MRYKSPKHKLIIILFILIYLTKCSTSQTKCNSLMSNESADACDGHNDHPSDLTVCPTNSDQTRVDRDCHSCKCYSQCLSRGLVLNATKGWFGTHFSPDLTVGSSQYCLWIVTVHPVLDWLSLYWSGPRPTSPSNAAISVTIEKDMRVQCPHSNIQVFDGVPDFVASGLLSKKLGFYCGTDLTKDIELVAYSGFLTVFFERRDSSQVFNASYVRLDCESCHAFADRHCADNQCVCLDYRIGAKCQVNICPNNCSADAGQGTCDQMNGRCVCMPKFGGEDCSQFVDLSTNRLILVDFVQLRSG